MPFGLRYKEPKPPRPKPRLRLLPWIVGFVVIIAIIIMLDPVIEREGRTIAALHEIDAFVHAHL